MSVGQRAFVCTDGAAKWTNIDIALVAQRCGLCETQCAKVAVASTHYKCSSSSYIRTNPRLFPLCCFSSRQNTLQQKDVTHATGGTKKGSYHNNGGETGSLCVSHVLRAIWVLPIHSTMQADRTGEMEEKMVIKRGAKSSNNTHKKHSPFFQVHRKSLQMCTNTHTVHFITSLHAFLQLHNNSKRTLSRLPFSGQACAHTLGSYMEESKHENDWPRMTPFPFWPYLRKALADDPVQEQIYTST